MSKFEVVNLADLPAKDLARMEEIAEWHSKEVDGEEWGDIKIDWKLLMYNSAQNWIDTFLIRDENNTIQGYCFIQYGKDYHRDQINGYNSGLFIMPEYRDGMIGYNFLKYIMNNVRCNGFLEFDVRPAKDYSLLLIRLGFEVRSIHYAKPIKKVLGG